VIYLFGRLGSFILWTTEEENMASSQSEAFEFEGKKYEIRVTCGGGRISVRAYRGDLPANGYEYSVDEDTSFDLTHVTGIGAVRHLMKQAGSDVENKVYESYLREKAKRVVLNSERCSKRMLRLAMRQCRF